MKNIDKNNFISLYIDLFEAIENRIDDENVEIKEDLLDLLEQKTRPFFESEKDEEDFSEKIAILINSKQEDGTFIIPNLGKLTQEDKNKYYFKENGVEGFLADKLEEHCSYIYETFDLKNAVKFLGL